MDKRWTIGLGIASAVLLLAAMFGADRMKRDDDAEVDEAVQTPATFAQPPPVETATAPPTTAPPPPPAVAEGGSTALTGKARSVAFEGAVSPVKRVEVRPGNNVAVQGEVFDRNGARVGRGTLSASGEFANLDGDGLSLTGAIKATRNSVALTPGQSSLRGAAVTVSASKLTIRSPEHPNGAAVAGPARVVLDGGSVTFEAQQAKVSFASGVLELAHGGGRSTLSWAGSGRITAPGQPAFTGQWLGVKAKELKATLRLSDMQLDGGAEVQQVYVDGFPKLRADNVAVDLPAPPQPMPAGSRGSFSWAPRNASKVDMAILKIGPGNAQAAWINLNLDPMPPMFGGENKTPPGGDTSGMAKKGSGFFGSSTAAPIDAVILPGTADRESITYDIPPDTKPGRYELVVVFEGNFNRLRVVIPFEVTARPPSP